MTDIAESTESAVAPRSAPDAGQSRRGWHRIESFDACPQRFAYRYLLRLEPARADEHLALGSLVHIGLMTHYLAVAGRSSVDPIEAMRSAPPRIAFCFERARRIVDAYRAAYPAEPFTVLDVEREFELRVRGHLHTQRMDLVVAWNGHVVVLDHKTAGRPGGTIKWETHGQFISIGLFGRHVLSQLYGLPWGGAVVNYLGTGTSPEFVRLPVPIEPTLLGPAAEALAESNAAIEALAARDPWRYKRNHGACMGQYACKFIPLCLRGRAALGEYIEAEDVATRVTRNQ